MNCRNLLCAGSMHHAHVAKPAGADTTSRHDPHLLITNIYVPMRRKAAAELAARGASVTLACRNVGAAEAAAADIRCALRLAPHTSQRNV
jgi:hypothetical protein